MLFSSMSFIFIFLPIVFLLYYISKKELRNYILLVASIIFYAWGEPKYLVLLLLTIIINYIGALIIEKIPKYKKVSIILAVTSNLLLLIYFKYFTFILTNLKNIFHLQISIIDVFLPIGISFYIFQAISYIVDVYRGESKAQQDIFKLALYISMFPQLIAGPIIKYHDISDQIDSREVEFDKVNLGVKRFIIGLSKKVLIANSMAIIADKIFIQNPQDFTPFVAWIGSVSFALQIYFDFSGYSDMAIGLGLIFGFKYMENFNYPYISKSMTEFWHRWHISLITWFKRYLYIPLGGSKHGQLKTIKNIAIVFILSGLWHGAQWKYIIWGMWHGFFVILERIFNIKDFELKKHAWYVILFQYLYFNIVHIISVVIFRSPDLKYAYEYFKNMFGLLYVNTDKVMYQMSYYIDTIEIITFVIAILCCMPIFKNILEVKHNYAKIVVNIWLLVLFFLSVITIASDTYNPFIYFRF